MKKKDPYPAIVRCVYGIECHKKVVDHDGDAVGGQENHDDDLVASRISQMRQKPIDRRHARLWCELSLEWEVWPQRGQSPLGRARGRLEHLQHKKEKCDLWIISMAFTMLLVPDWVD